MSWAEIKKAVNSNLGVPLDKYIGGGKFITISNTSITIPTSGDAITLLEINSPCLVYWIQALGYAKYNNYDTKVSIYIDGVETCGFHGVCSSSAGDRAGYVGYRKINDYTSPETNYGVIKHNSQYFFDQSIKPTVEMNTSSGTYRGDAEISNPIYCKSIKATAREYSVTLAEGHAGIYAIYQLI